MRYCLCLAAILLALTSVVQCQIPPSYGLACRGPLRFEFTVTSYQACNLTLWFERGSVGANYAAPSPGQCTWMDRSVSSWEPNVIVDYRSSPHGSIQICSLEMSGMGASQSMRVYGIDPIANGLGAMVAPSNIIYIVNVYSKNPTYRAGYPTPYPTTFMQPTTWNSTRSADLYDTQHPHTIQAWKQSLISQVKLEPDSDLSVVIIE